MSDPTDHGAWLDALADGAGYGLVCPEGHGSLPPRRVCPHCGAGDLATEPLPETGELATYSVVHVAAPRFSEDTPYVTAVAEFDGVRLTGVLRGADDDALETGRPVTVTVGERETDGERIVVFEPA